MTGIGQYELRIRGERVELLGTQTGKLEAVAIEKGLVVLKEAGHHFYSGQGQPFRYAPATYAVYAVPSWRRCDEAGDLPWEEGVVVEKLVEWPVRPLRA